MAGWAGMIFGGVVAVFLLSMLLEWALFKRITDSPKTGIPFSVCSAVILAIVIYGFGHANGGAWNAFPNGVAYIIGGAIVLAFRMWEYGRRVERDDLGETFR